MNLPSYSLYKQAHIGVSLGSNSVRMVQVGKGDEVIKKAVAFSTKEFFSGSGVDSTTLVSLLKKTLADGAFEIKYVALSIPERFVFTRQHLLPNIPLNEVTEALGWQIESVFPFSASEVFVDWQLIKKDEKGVSVLVMAIQKHVVNTLVKSIDSVGLIPIAIEPSASAIVRSLNQEDKNFILLELDTSGTTTTSVVNKIATATSTTHFGTATDPQIVLRDIVASINNLIQRQQSGESTSNWEVYLTGEKATEQLVSVLSKQINIPVHLFPHKQSEPSIELAYIMARSLVVAPADSFGINLLPEQITKGYHLSLSFRQARVMLIAIIALTISSLVFASISMIIPMIIVNQTQSEIQMIQSEQVQLTSLQASVISNSQRVNTLFPSKVTPEAYLSEFLETIPSEITIKSLLFDTEKQVATLVGNADDRSALLLLKNQLEEIDMVQVVTVPLSSLEANTDINFVFTIALVID